MRSQYAHLASETTLVTFKAKVVSLVDRVRASLRRLEIAKRAPRAGDKLAAFATRLYQTFVDSHPDAKAAAAAAAENGGAGAEGIGLDHKLTRNLHDAVHRIRATLEAKVRCVVCVLCAKFCACLVWSILTDAFDCLDTLGNRRQRVAAVRAPSRSRCTCTRRWPRSISSP